MSLGQASDMTGEESGWPWWICNVRGPGTWGSGGGAVLPCSASQVLGRASWTPEMCAGVGPRRVASGTGGLSISTSGAHRHPPPVTVPPGFAHILRVSALKSITYKFSPSPMLFSRKFLTHPAYFTGRALTSNPLYVLACREKER